MSCPSQLGAAPSTPSAALPGGPHGGSRSKSPGACRLLHKAPRGSCCCQFGICSSSARHGCLQPAAQPSQARGKVRWWPPDPVQQRLNWYPLAMHLSGTALHCNVHGVHYIFCVLFFFAAYVIFRSVPPSVKNTDCPAVGRNLHCLHLAGESAAFLSRAHLQSQDILHAFHPLSATACLLPPSITLSRNFLSCKAIKENE